VLVYKIARKLCGRSSAYLHLAHLQVKASKTLSVRSIHIKHITLYKITYKYSIEVNTTEHMQLGKFHYTALRVHA